MMDLFNQYLENLRSFISSFEDLSEKNFNTKPGADSWSVTEVVEHIYRTELASTQILKSETRASDHDTEAKIKEISLKFIDRSKKLTAFGPIVPKGNMNSSDELIQKISNNRENQIASLQSLDMDGLCLMFEHPLFGYMTRKEWILFNSTHASRHKAQIEEIREILSV